MDGYEFALTPRSGERLAAADELAQQANLLGLVVGHDVAETAFGRNMGLRIASSGLRRFARQEFGDLALSAVPTATGLTVRIPATTLHLRGDTIALRGADVGGGQTLTLAGLTPGNYAVLLESWVALVGATTLGQAQIPDVYTGIVDSASKPDSLHLYNAGNLDGGGLADAVLADTTLQVHKVLQRQYQLSLIPDRSLVGLHTALLPAGETYAITLNPDLVQCLLPEGLGAWDTAVDRRFLACKLAVATFTGSAVTLHTSDFRQADAFDHLGQRPAPLRLGREDLEIWLRGIADDLSAQQLALESRLGSLESQRHAALLTSDAAQLVLPRSRSGSIGPQPLRYTNEIWDTEGWHDKVSYPTRVRVDFTGVAQVTASASFAASPDASGLRGLRLMQNGLPTAAGQTSAGDSQYDSEVTLCAEITVAAGDSLEIEAWQGSAGGLDVRAGASFAVRRLL